MGRVHLRDCSQRRYFDSADDWRVEYQKSTGKETLPTYRHGHGFYQWHLIRWVVDVVE